MSEAGQNERREYGSFLTPEQRSANARRAALIRHSQSDGTRATQAARDAFMYEKFANQVDPERRLAPSERMRRIKRARRAWMMEISRKSTRVRKARAEAIRARLAKNASENADDK